MRKNFSKREPMVFGGKPENPVPGQSDMQRDNVMTFLKIRA